MPDHQGASALIADAAHEPLAVATAAARSGDRVRARRLLTELTHRQPDHEAAWIWLASVAADSDEAIRALRAASRVAPTRERTIGSLARLLQREGVAAAQAGDAERARALLAECTDLVPDDARAWLWLASAAASRTDAISCLRRTLAIEPGHELARGTLRRLLLHEGATAAQSGDGDRAGAYLAEASALYPHDEDARLARTAFAAHDGPTRGVPGVVGAQPQLDDVARIEAEALAEARAEAASTLDRPLVRVRARASVRTTIVPGFDPLTHDVIALGESSATADSRLVMVVDDSPAVQQSVAVTLERYGHRVLAARDETDALEKLARLEPDLILLDVSTTLADGYRVCRTLRSTLGRRGVPVVLSGTIGVAGRIRGWMAGAADSIAKPFAERALISVVDRYAASPN
jgi:CheY-like chemotaxis protein